VRRRPRRAPDPLADRLADGRYRFDEVDCQVPVTEPEKHNAIHGLLRWRAWGVQHSENNRVAMATRLHPMRGYPFLLDIEVDYALDQQGLTVVTTAANRGVRACPYGAGSIPTCPRASV
jgi:aldose 1-epimerase